jgi:hypothetical protein
MYYATITIGRKPQRKEIKRRLQERSWRGCVLRLHAQARPAAGQMTTSLRVTGWERWMRNHPPAAAFKQSDSSTHPLIFRVLSCLAAGSPQTLQGLLLHGCWQEYILNSSAALSDWRIQSGFNQSDSPRRILLCCSSEQAQPNSNSNSSTTGCLCLQQAAHRPSRACCCMVAGRNVIWQCCTQ